MKHVLCAVHDKASALFGRPFAVPAVGIAIREFSDAVNSEKSEMTAHPEDYTLFKLGTYDDNTGVVESAVEPLGNGVTYVTRDPKALELVKKATA